MASRSPDAEGHEVTGEGVLCPCCGWSGRAFRSFGRRQRRNAKCPECDALERHRALLLFLRDRTNLFRDDVRLLHFAPETSISKVIRSYANINYVTTDLYRSRVSVKMDIVDLLFRDGVFDFILCSHVLEHIPDDRQAIRELYRVLKPQGVALVLVPLFHDLVQTFEDPSITNPDERARVFGQSNHVRQPGRDYHHRLEEAGFIVDIVDYGAQIGSDLARRYGLATDGKMDPIFVCTKPAP
jgi:SAM-dependent methyltransferase